MKFTCHVALCSNTILKYVTTNECFDNYYKTPYVIHANDSAKKIFNKEFKGIGKDMSPMFLMSYLFEYCGIKGDEYNQYLTDLSKQSNIIHNSTSQR